MAQRELLQVLEKTASQSPNDQRLAIDYLKQVCITEFPEFIKHLSSVLSNKGCTNFVGQAAGIKWKNVLIAKEEATRIEYLRRWLTLPEDALHLMKQNVLLTLGTETFRPSIAAQCVAAIACADISSRQWPEVITCLQHNVTATNTDMLKELCVEALDYICQDINASTLEGRANEMFTTLVHALRREESPNHVRLAAANTMLNSLEFTKNNFGNGNERHVIMQVACEASQCPEALAKVAAMQWPVRIMSLHHQFMGQFVTCALSLKMQIDDVALQGIEFWSNVCEEEIALCMDAEEAQEQRRTLEQVSRHYAKGPRRSYWRS